MTRTLTICTKVCSHSFQHCNKYFKLTDLSTVVVTGDSGVGKTNIITRFTTNEFHMENKATIGVEFGHAEVVLSDNTKIKVQIWDTGTFFTFVLSCFRISQNVRFN